MFRSADFQDCRVLVVEDEYVIAEDLRLELEALGAQVIGPAPTTDKALKILANAPQIDCAILDINLQGHMAFEVADALVQREVPFIFATAYSEENLPRRFEHIVTCSKPLRSAEIAETLRKARQRFHPPTPGEVRW